MTNYTINDYKIQQLYSKYQNKYTLNLPKIKYIKYVNSNDFWARFNTNDLYNKEYILYICKDLLNKNNPFIRQILFHEFTHLSDSLQFTGKSLEEFKNIMVSYSEFHASKREMRERLEEINTNDISLQTIITHADSITIDSFMEQTFGFMIDDLNKMSSNSNANNLFYNARHVYYFFGISNALKEFGVEYDFKLYKIPPCFFLAVKQIYEDFSSNIINIEDVLRSYIKLNDDVKFQFLMNRIKH